MEVRPVQTARTARERFLGLMGRRDLERAFLLIPRCTSIHTCFMRGPIDVAFLDPEGRVVRQQARVAPWRVVFGPGAAVSTLELPPGYLERNKIGPGDLIRCSD